ncbi:hypothetical protein Agub_g15127, partial [Astrephomene gubernaculifera]
MQTLSPALMASTSEVLVAAAATWMGYLSRLAAAAQGPPASQPPAAGDPSSPSPSPAPPAAVPLPTPSEVSCLVSCGLGPALVTTVRQQLQAALESHAVPGFWRRMALCRTAAAAGDEEALEGHLLAGLKGLCGLVE